jgi:hypothetical protein
MDIDYIRCGDGKRVELPGCQSFDNSGAESPAYANFNTI